MNFIDGRLEKRDAGWVFVAEGFDVPLSTYAFQDPDIAPRRAVLGVRPEHVGLNTGSGWPFSRDVRIDVVEPMGSDTLVWTSLSGQNFSMRVSSERAPEVGDKASIGFDPLRASVFDAESGVRL